MHGDDETLAELAFNNDKITYGTKKLYDIVGSIVNTGTEYISFQWATRYTASSLKNAPVVVTQLVGIYNYHNLLCAACVGNYFKVEDALINKALTEYSPSNNRSQLQKTENNTLILDYYNANPTSMNAAIENFANLKQENKVAILGDMLELGEESQKEHEAIIQLLKQKNIQALLVGPLFCNAGNRSSFQLFANSDDANSYLKSNPIKNATILIKGSRGIKLEKVLDTL